MTVSRRNLFIYGVPTDLVILGIGLGLLYPGSVAVLLVAFIAAAALSAWKGGWPSAATAIGLGFLALATTFNDIIHPTQLVVFVAGALVASTIVRSLVRASRHDIDDHGAAEELPASAGEEPHTPVATQPLAPSPLAPPPLAYATAGTMTIEEWLPAEERGKFTLERGTLTSEQTAGIDHGGLVSRGRKTLGETASKDVTVGEEASAQASAQRDEEQESAALGRLPEPVTEAGAVNEQTAPETSAPIALPPFEPHDADATVAPLEARSENVAAISSAQLTAVISTAEALPLSKRARKSAKVAARSKATAKPANVDKRKSRRERRRQGAAEEPITVVAPTAAAESIEAATSPALVAEPTPAGAAAPAHSVVADSSVSDVASPQAGIAGDTARLEALRLELERRAEERLAREREEQRVLIERQFEERLAREREAERQRLEQERQRLEDERQRLETQHEAERRQLQAEREAERQRLEAEREALRREAEERVAREREAIARLEAEKRAAEEEARRLAEALTTEKPAAVGSQHVLHGQPVVAEPPVAGAQPTVDAQALAGAQPAVDVHPQIENDRDHPDDDQEHEEDHERDEDLERAAIARYEADQREVQQEERAPGAATGDFEATMREFHSVAEPELRIGVDAEGESLLAAVLNGTADVPAAADDAPSVAGEIPWTFAPAAAEPAVADARPNIASSVLTPAEFEQRLAEERERLMLEMAEKLAREREAAARAEAEKKELERQLAEERLAASRQLQERRAPETGSATGHFGAGSSPAGAGPERKREPFAPPSIPLRTYGADAAPRPRAASETPRLMRRTAPPPPSPKSLLESVTGWFSRKSSPPKTVNLTTRKAAANSVAAARKPTNPGNTVRRPAIGSERPPRLVFYERRRATADAALPRLKQSGIEATIVERLIDAIDEISRLKPDVVLIDSELPEFEKEYRYVAEHFPQLPLFVTGRSPAAVPSREQLHYAGFIVRPYDADDLIRIGRDVRRDPDSFSTTERTPGESTAPARVMPIPLTPVSSTRSSRSSSSSSTSSTSLTLEAVLPAATLAMRVTEDGRYEATCFHCRTPFQAMEADWCSCLTKERTLVCTNCLSCFCKAPPSYKEKFWLNAPSALFERKTAEARRTASMPPNPSPSDVSRPLVLSVEDDEEIQHIVQRVCTNLGYGYIYALNGLDGLNLARLYRPNLILSDAFMPKLDGREMCRQLKDEPAGADCKMVVMTGLYTDTKYRSEALKRFHVDDYLSKPVAITELINLLQRHLEGVAGLPQQEDLHRLHRRVMEEEEQRQHDEDDDASLSSVLTAEEEAELAMERAALASAGEEPKGETYEVCCFNCNNVFDATHAEWCSCVGRDNTLVCPTCNGCFCKAPAAYRERFWIDAPSSLFERKMLGSKRQVSLRTNPEPDEVKRPLILLVEDDENVQLIVRTVVTTMGFGFIVGANGQEGLTLAHDYEPDLILSDAFMPKLDGREMCRLLKSDPATSRAKAIIMTGLYTDRKYRNEALDYFKVDDYVAKPLAVDDLIKLFKKHLPQEVQAN